MKTLLLFGMVFASAANAFDWNDFLKITGKKIKDSFSVQKPFSPAEADKPGNCDFPVNLKPEEAKYFIETKKPAIIDVRTPEEYASGRIENAANIDFYGPDFKEKLSKLDKSAKYLIYCRSGRRSANTLTIMKELGFAEAHHIEGGILAWIQAGLPVLAKL